MRFMFRTGYPYTFYVETGGGQSRYYVSEHKKGQQEEDEPREELTAEVWERLLQAQQVEHLSTLAGAFDVTQAVGTGRIPTIAQSIADIANEIAPMIDADVLFDSERKSSNDEEEPS